MRRTAKSIGASLLGICEYDKRWVYRTRFSEQARKGKPVEIPEDLPYVIVIGEPVEDRPMAAGFRAPGNWQLARGAIFRGVITREQIIILRRAAQ